MLTESHIEIKTLPGQYDLLALNTVLPERYPFLLESSALARNSPADDKPANTRGFDILFAFPQEKLTKSHDDCVYLDEKKLHDTSFLKELNKQYILSQNTIANTTLPFIGGWFLYLSYELAAEIEPTLKLSAYDEQVPVAQAIRIPAAIIYDHNKNATHLIAEKSFSHCLDYMQSDISMHTTNTAGKVFQSVLEEEPAENYISNTKKVLDYIKDGDVFQVNLSRYWRTNIKLDANPVDVYRNLRKNNPAPFSAMAKLDNTWILSSSPERLIKVSNRIAETRPIAGTRPRSEHEQVDNALQSELIGNIKERAEHVMLIDLERNDLGRICRPGSIHVNELMVIESYAHVHHIVSNISGTLREEVMPGDIIAAVFPGGTITGCPKVRCMEIIQELENSARGAYTGSLGYLNTNGDMDLNILIRTVVMHNGQATFRAGAGLVADSDPDKELDETRAKAKGMALALNG